MDELPGIIIALVIIYFVARWFRGPSKPDGIASGDTPTSGPLRGVTPEMISTVTSAFPHITPAAIVYSLSKTKSAQATVEQILEPRGIPEPPATFPVHPYLQRLATTAATTSTSFTTNSVPSISTTDDPTTPNKPTSKSSKTLIDRYGLSTVIATEEKGKGKAKAVELPEIAGGAEGEGKAEEVSVTKPGPSKWESTAEGRQNALNERKREMVLEARRRMLEKKAAKQVAA